MGLHAACDRFVTARRRLEPEFARARDLDELEGHLRRATAVKNDIVQANLRLVVSVARKHLRPGLSLMELISDGNVTLTGPMLTGVTLRLGPMVRLRIGGVDVIVYASGGSQTFDPEVFLLHGIDVRRYKYVGLKSSQHFRAGFGDLAAQTRALEVNLIGAARTVEVVVPAMVATAFTLIAVDTLRASSWTIRPPDRGALGPILVFGTFEARWVLYLGFLFLLGSVARLYSSRVPIDMRLALAAVRATAGK